MKIAAETRPTVSLVKKLIKLALTIESYELKEFSDWIERTERRLDHFETLLFLAVENKASAWICEHTNQH